MKGLGGFGPLHSNPVRVPGGRRPTSGAALPRGSGHQAGTGQGEHVLCFPAATPPPCKTRTHVVGSPKTKVQRLHRVGGPARGTQKRGGAGAQPRATAVERTLTGRERACRAWSPLSGTLWTLLLSGTVHCQQLPKGKIPVPEIGPTKEEHMYDRPWLVMTGDGRGRWQEGKRCII